MMALVEAYGCTIDSSESRGTVDQLAWDGLQAVDIDSEFGTLTRLSVARATPIHRTVRLDGA